MKQRLFSLIYSLLLLSFTVYLLLDTFVIARVYTAQGSPAPRQTSDPYATLPPAVSQDSGLAEGAPIITDRSYTDASIAIAITGHRVQNTTVYVADVTLAAPSLLRTALAQGAYGRNVTQKTSAMAADVNAILAINGDYYGSRERGYVARNGTLYRSRAAADTEALAIMADGSFRVVTEGDVSAESLMEAGAVHLLSFGPALLVDGKIAVTPEDEVGKAMEDNPRTAIGIYEPGHYVLLVSDGRTRESEGLTLYELAEFMQGLGITSAYNLDGGGSSTMVFMGEVVNNPTTNGRKITERSVSDIVYIGY